MTVNNDRSIFGYDWLGIGQVPNHVRSGCKLTVTLTVSASTVLGTSTVTDLPSLWPLIIFFWAAYLGSFNFLFAKLARCVACNHLIPFLMILIYISADVSAGHHRLPVCWAACMFCTSTRRAIKNRIPALNSSEWRRKCYRIRRPKEHRAQDTKNG